MKKSMSFVFAAFAAVLLSFGLVGCGLFRGDTRPIGPDGERLNRIPGVRAVEIPAGFTDAQVLDAVERAIAATSSGVHIAGLWYPEGRDPGNRWIRVGMTVRRHYLCVCYRIENGQLVPDVPTSTNLKQSGVKIHRRVPGWINGFNALISQQLYGAKTVPMAR